MMNNKSLLTLLLFILACSQLQQVFPLQNQTAQQDVNEQKQFSTSLETHSQARKLQFFPVNRQPFQPFGFQPGFSQPTIPSFPYPTANLPTLNQPYIAQPQEKAPIGQAHSFRLTPAYTQDIMNSGQFPKITTIFGIAATYFFRILKVRYLDQSQVIYRQWNIQCTVIPAHYSQRGFDQNKTDAVVGVGTTPSVGNGGSMMLAWAAPCYVSRRVVYGVIMFNLQGMGTSYLGLHNSAQVTIHQMTHMLGFSSGLYDKYFTSPTSSVKRSRQSVIRQIGGRQYIVTPKVMEYIRKYFGCNDGTGALLALENDSSHWDKTVFRNQYMTPIAEISGGRVTRLTLALLKDTGYYDSVSETLSEPTKYGFQKGCSFARGQVAQESCAANTCDYYGRFLRAGCSQGFDQPIRGQICQDEAQGAGSDFNAYTQSRPRTTPSAYNNYKFFGYLSRCFMLANRGYGGFGGFGGLGGTSCYKAGCTSNGRTIILEVGGIRGRCTAPNQQVVINRVGIICPSNFEAFCSYRGCKNFCSGRGICINSRCVCKPPYRGIDCSF